MPIFRRARVFEPSPSGAATIVPTVTYVGPGDVVGGALGWWGLRAYTAASIGSNVVKIRRSSDNTLKTFVSISGGGINTADAFFDGSNYFIETLYDQTGNGNNMVMNNNLVANTNQPQFSLTAGPGSNITAIFVVASTLFLTTSTTGNSFTNMTDFAQPFSFSAVAQCTDSAAQRMIAGGNAANLRFGNDILAANQCFLYVGSSIPTATASDNAYHALMGVYHDATQSKIYVDGTGNNVSLGTTGGGSSSNSFQIASYNTSGQGAYGGNIQEVGVWASDIGSSAAALSTNQKSYWGF